MTKFDQRMNAGGLLFWALVLLTTCGLYGFLFLALALGQLFI